MVTSRSKSNECVQSQSSGTQGGPWTSKSAWPSGGSYLREALLIGILGVAVAWPTLIQGDGELATPYSASGQEVSFYFAVENFLTTAADALDASRDAFNYTILSELKLEPGSAGALELERAVDLSQTELSRYVDLRPYTNDPGEYNRRQEEFQRSRARRITEIFNTMLVDVEAAGGDPMAIIGYIESKIRPRVVLMSDKANFLTTERVFQIVDEEFFLITDEREQPKQ